MTNFRGGRVIQVVEIVTLEGEGTPRDVAREVRTYCDLDGKVLAINDPAPFGFWRGSNPPPEPTTVPPEG